MKKTDFLTYIIRTDGGGPAKFEGTLRQAKVWGTKRMRLRKANDVLLYLDGKVVASRRAGQDWRNSPGFKWSK